MEKISCEIYVKYYLCTIELNGGWKLDEGNVVGEEPGVPVLVGEEGAGDHGDLGVLLLADVVGAHDDLDEAGAET